MDLTSEFIAAEEDVIRRNENYLKQGGNAIIFKIVNSFLDHYKTILNIGSG